MFSGIWKERGDSRMAPSFLSCRTGWLVVPFTQRGLSGGGPGMVWLHMWRHPFCFRDVNFQRPE